MRKLIPWIRISAEILVLSLVMLVAIPQAQTALSRSIAWVTTSKLAMSSVSPTISSGFGTSPSITANGSTAGKITIGTGGTASSGVLALPTASGGWYCTVVSSNDGSYVRMTTSTTTTATIAKYGSSTASAIAFLAGDTLFFGCTAY